MTSSNGVERDWRRLSLWALRLGLAWTYLYSGTDLLRHPTAWVAYIPFWFKELLPFEATLFLQIQGAVEIAFALSFFTGILLRPVSLLAAGEMAAILLFYGVDGVTFRDIAILGAAAAIFFSTFEAPRDAVVAKT